MTALFPGLAPLFQEKALEINYFYGLKPPLLHLSKDLLQLTQTITTMLRKHQHN